MLDTVGRNPPPCVLFISLDRISIVAHILNTVGSRAVGMTSPSMTTSLSIEITGPGISETCRPAGELPSARQIDGR